MYQYRKNSRQKLMIQNIIFTYFAVLIPLVMVSLWASGRTIDQLEKSTYQAMQGRVERTAQSLKEIYGNYKGSAVSLAAEASFRGEFWRDNSNRFNAVELIQSVGRQDMLVQNTFLYHPAGDAVYSSVGYSGGRVFLRETMGLDAPSQARAAEMLVQEGKSMAGALWRSDGINGYMLFHFPTSSMVARSVVSVNYLISFDKLSEKMRSISTGMPVYIRLVFEDQSIVCFYEAEGKIRVQPALPEGMTEYVCITEKIPSMQLDMEVFYHPEELYQPVRRGQRTSLQLLAVGLMLSTLISVVLSTSRMKKLRRLADVAKGAPVEFRRRDEYAFIGNLLSNSAHEISALTSSLKDYGKTIRQQTLQLMLRGAVKDRETANQLLRSGGMELSEEFYCVGGVYAQTESKTFAALLEKIQGELSCIVDTPRGPMIAFLLELPNEDQQKEIRLACAGRYQALLGEMQLKGRICLSQVYQELSMVELAFGEVMEARDEEAPIVCFDDLMGNKKQVLQLDPEDLQQFALGLREKNLKKAQTAFRQMHEKLLAAHCNPANKAYLRYCILQLIIAALEEDGEDSAGLLQWACSMEVADDAQYERDICELLQRFLSVPSPQLDIERITAYIQAHYPDPGLSAAAVAEFAGINKAHLGQVFKAHFGKTYIEYVSFVRLEKAKELLENTDLTIQEIANQVGYWDHSSFRRKFRSQYDIGVSEYRKQIKGEEK